MGERRISSRQAVLAEVRHRIISLNVAPGAALSENDIAADLGVSRTPVREAIVLLADEGMVQVFPQVGTFVSLVDPARVRDAQFLRESVELASLADLGSSDHELDPEAVAALEANLLAQIDAVGDDEQFFRLDEAFHKGLMGLAGHEGVWSSVASAKGHLDRARCLGMAHLPANDQMRSQHAAILAAVRSGDHDGAATVLRDHLRTVLGALAAIQEASPSLFAGATARKPARRTVAE